MREPTPRRNTDLGTRCSDPDQRDRDTVRTQATAAAGRARLQFRLDDGRLLEVETICLPPADWPGCLESHEPGWQTLAYGESLLAQRVAFG